MPENPRRGIWVYLPSGTVTFFFFLGALIAVGASYIPDDKDGLGKIFAALSPNAIFIILPFAAFIKKSLVEIGDIIGAIMVITYIADKFNEAPLFKQLTEHLSRVFIDIVFRDLRLAQSYGLTGLHDRVDLVELVEGLLPGDELHVLGTYVARIGERVAGVREAAERGVKFRCLIMDPASPMLALRAQELSSTYSADAADTYAHDLQWSLSLLREWKDELDESQKENIQFETYVDLIGSPMFLVFSGGKPTYACSGIYLNHTATTEAAWFRWSGNGLMFKLLDRYMKQKWRHAQAWSAKPRPLLPDVLDTASPVATD